MSHTAPRNDTSRTEDRPGADAASRVSYAKVELADELFSPEFLSYFVPLHDALRDRIVALLARRAEALRLAAEQHGRINEASWRKILATLGVPSRKSADRAFRVPPLPEELLRRGIEISGPCSVTPMFINALNPGPGPEGERAVGDLDDDEDSSGQRLIDTLRACHNRTAAVSGTLFHYDADKKKEYRLKEGALPFLIHRERGLHLFEEDVRIDGQPVSAAILGTALTLYYCGRAQVERGQGIYFYIPKLEFPDEARLYRDMFDLSRAALPWLAEDRAVIRAIALVESLPCVYQMEEILEALLPYAAGLNAARWDLKASIFEYVMTDPRSVWPDRFGVDIKTTPFLGDIFRRLVAVCRRHGAVAIGGMATALPSSDPEVNRVAAEAIRKDKEWEAAQGFLRGWVAHIFHMKTAAEPFLQVTEAAGRFPEDPDDFPVRIEVPSGPITLEGSRRNCRMLLEYLEGWMNGRGAKGIDSLAGQPGARPALMPALMEDLATGRMSVAQLAQRIRHRAATTAGPAAVHDEALVKSLLTSELADILRRGSLDEAARARYHAAWKIALRWIKNYCELDFRSLASYPRSELERIAAAGDAF
jgi:malate synthase